MIDSEEYERDRVFRKRLLRGASILFASITASKSDEKVNSVHKALAEETGLVATFGIKLITLKDEAILKSVF